MTADDPTAAPASPTDTRDADPRPSLGGDDWPQRVTDQIVGFIDQTREKTTDRAIMVLRILVFGSLLTVLGIIAVVFVVVVAVRVADAYVPIGDGVGSGTWAAHALVGFIFSALGGSLLWARSGGVGRKVVIGAIIPILAVFIILLVVGLS